MILPLYKKYIGKINQNDYLFLYLFLCKKLHAFWFVAATYITFPRSDAHIIRRRLILCARIRRLLDGFGQFSQLVKFWLIHSIKQRTRVQRASRESLECHSLQACYARERIRATRLDAMYVALVPRASGHARKLHFLDRLLNYINDQLLSCLQLLLFFEYASWLRTPYFTRYLWVVGNGWHKQSYQDIEITEITLLANII